MDLLTPDSKIFIIPNSNDKPVKLIFEDVKSNIITRDKTQKEALMETIFHMRFSINKITTQQYKSEKGKIRRNNFKEVINFITKRNNYDFYQQSLNEPIIIMTIKHKFPVSCLKENKFGMLKL